MTPPTVVEYEEEMPRSSERGAWMRLLALILASIALPLVSGALWGVVNHEHRMTAVEQAVPELRESDRQLRTDMKEMKDDIRSDVKEMKADIKKLLERR